MGVICDWGPVGGAMVCVCACGSGSQGLWVCYVIGGQWEGLWCRQ